jgi:hypothetical protein
LDAMDAAAAGGELPEGFPMFRTAGRLVWAALPDPDTRTVNDALAGLRPADLNEVAAAINGALLQAFGQQDADPEAPRPANRASKRAASRGGRGTTRQRSSSAAHTKSS